MVEDEIYWIQFHKGLPTQTDDEIFDYLKKGETSRMQLSLAKRYRFEIEGEHKVLYISTR